jgi:hypothetical protein
MGCADYLSIHGLRVYIRPEVEEQLCGLNVAVTRSDMQSAPPAHL